MRRRHPVPTTLFLLSAVLLLCLSQPILSAPASSASESNQAQPLDSSNLNAAHSQDKLLVRFKDGGKASTVASNAR